MESYTAGLNLLAAAPYTAVVSVLVEVPVMLSVVSIMKRTQHWFARASASAGLV